MRIIPVLDLKDGLVMRACAGRRDDYRAIETPLSTTADPVDVAAGFQTVHPFDTFYCADLDAIGRRAPNDDAVARLCAMPGQPDLWIDAGFDTVEKIDAALARPSLRPVLGTESQRDAALLQHFASHPRLILSLDFFADGFRGPRDLLETHSLWPQTVIVMTLARVGLAGGPDIELLQGIKARSPTRAIIAAGGIRHAADVEALHSIGVSGALVATALHNGTIAARHFADFRQ